jgi:hypothetical protein
MRESHISRPQSTAWLVVERIKVVVEILAFGAAGAWALFTFINDEERTYQQRGELGGDLNWVSDSATPCTATYSVSFKNIGKRPVVISAGAIRVSEMKDPLSMLADTKASVLDAIELRKTSVWHDLTNEFNNVYQPDEGHSETYWLNVDGNVQWPIMIELSLWDDDRAAKSRKAIEAAERRVNDDANWGKGASWNDHRIDWPCGKNPHASSGTKPN